MPRKAASKGPVPRKRRTADEARNAILDAAERRLSASGPDAIRLQEVAADVGVSHPTILHHFGSREGLLDAVVKRALEPLHADLLAAVQGSSDGVDQVATLLDAVFETVVVRGYGRTFLWLALSGYAPTQDLRMHALADAVQSVRIARRAGKKSAPSFEDTYFTVLLPALALLSLSVNPSAVTSGSRASGTAASRRFRRWLAGLIHRHLESDEPPATDLP